MESIVNQKNTLAEPKKNEARTDLIDYIRGFCIIAVILLHINIREPFINSDIGKHLPKFLNNIIFYSGYYAVIIFFVISGFLITSNSIKRFKDLKHLNIKNFYVYRFARIVPTLLAIIAVLSVFHLLNIPGFIIKNTSLGNAIFSALTFHINYLESKVGYLPGPWDLLWSLSVEEVFYLFFPIVCGVIKKQFILILFLALLIIIGPIYRLHYENINEIWSDHSYFSCMDGIAFGCLTAIISNQVNFSKFSKMTFFLFGFFIFILVFLLRKFFVTHFLSQYSLNVTFLEFSIGLILLSNCGFKITPKKMFSKIIDSIRITGMNSYEIYLTHMFVVVILFQIKNLFEIKGMVLITYILTLFLSILIGKFIAKNYSNPLNNKLRKFLA